MERKKPTRNPDALIAAETLYSSYYEYINAGFTETEAMQLVNTILHSTIMAQHTRHKK